MGVEPDVQYLLQAAMQVGLSVCEGRGARGRRGRTRIAPAAAPLRRATGANCSAPTAARGAHAARPRLCSEPLHHCSKSEMIMMDKVEEEAYTTLGGTVSTLAS